MPLIKCPECNHDVSDKAVSCPNCGYPMNSPTSTKPRIRNGKPTKLPNNFGSVYKLHGRRRKPYRVVKTDKWVYDAATERSKQIRFTIGYYATREEAMIALSEYNAHPYDIKTDSVTFEEVYYRWSEEHFKTIVPSAQRGWKSAFNHCAPIHKMRMKDIRVNHLEQTIKDAPVGDNTKTRMKSLYNMMYRYALKYDIVEKDYARLCNTVERPEREIARIPFSDQEIQKLWDNIHIPFVDMVLIGIYTGFRPQELAILQINNIDLDQWTIIGGLKTDAGRNRLVPIHPGIRDLVQKNYDHARQMNSDYLFNDENGQRGTSLTYDKYRRRFNKIMDRLSMTHKPHDTKHTFVSMAKEAHMDEHILKLIVGHAENDITEKVYTHRTIEQLHEEIRKITK